jgi:uncharacterized cupredoxin-like copper-binding protein
MRRGMTVFALLALAAAGLGAGILASGGEAGARAMLKPKPKVVKITVTMREFRFTLSRRSVPTGTTVIFKVVNRGKITHDFKIAGKRTENVSPGKSTTLKVRFAKKGRYGYLCTIPGHAAAGMKGVFAVGVAAVKQTPTPTTTKATTTTATPPTGTVGTGNTTVTVSMTEYHFTLSQTSVPSGQVTFVIKNNGSETHNFDISTVKSGTYLNPGQSETWTVSLPPRTYEYQCDVPFHAQEGMQGSLTVTS